VPAEVRANRIVDRAVRYTLLCVWLCGDMVCTGVWLCLVMLWLWLVMVMVTVDYVNIRHITTYNAKSYQPLHSIRM
jgi:hypothetical protein